MGTTRNVLTAAVPILGVCIAPAVAVAGSSSTDLAQLERELRVQQQQLRETQHKLDEQLKRLKAQEAALKRQQTQIDAMRYSPRPSPAAGPAIAPADGVLGSGDLPIRHAAFEAPRVDVASSSTRFILGQAAPAAPSGAQTAPVTRPNQPEQRPEISTPALASQGGVLTPEGVFSFEPAFQYQYSSSNQFFISGLTLVPGITIGSTSVRQVVDRLHTFTFGGRYGITDRLEVEAQVPFVYRSTSTTVTPVSATSTGLGPNQINAYGSNLGDIQFGAHYQLNDGSDGWPFFVANVIAKSNSGRSPFDVPLDFTTGIPTRANTGTGFWAVQPSITMIYPSDPVVFFANLRYIKNIGSTVTLQPSATTGITSPTRTDVSPGDGFGGIFGMGFGINEKTSFSLAYEQTNIMSTEMNGVNVPGSNFDIGSFDLGFSYQLSPRTTVNLGIAIGSTKAAPDAAITLRVPIKFQVF